MPENARKGQPVWIDYVCQDFETTKSFYTTLFGWEVVDQGADFGHYHQIHKDGSAVGGFMRAMNPDGTPNLDIPTSWTTYLNTLSIHETYDSALASGAGAIVAPMAVGPLGEMAVVADPTGAVVGLWQSEAFTGFDLPLTPGTPVWFELLTTDYPLATDFYGEVFGFDLATMDGFDYSTHGDGPDAVAGICDASQWSIPQSYWRPYFNVENADASVEVIVRLGGTILDGPADSPFGRIVTAADPEGAVFQLQQNL